MEFYLNENEKLNDILQKAKPFDTIYLFNKIYNEKIKITIPNITIIGHEKGSIIQNKDYYNKIHSDNKEYLTVRTYTLMVASNNITLKNITIKNLSVPNKIYGQAVALHVIGDNFKAINLKLYGAQDTLLAGPIPQDLTIRYKSLLPIDELSTKKSHQYYLNCYIEGDVDFIFGSGIALFENCTINSIGSGYICAPSHNKELKFGFVFKNCHLTRNNGVTNVFLARPWREYGSAAFINCHASDHIRAEGFHYWEINRAKTCRFYNYLTIDSNKIAPFAHNLSETDILDYTFENIMNS